MGVFHRSGRVAGATRPEVVGTGVDRRQRRPVGGAALEDSPVADGLVRAPVPFPVRPDALGHPLRLPLPDEDGVAQTVADVDEAELDAGSVKNADDLARRGSLVRPGPAEGRPTVIIRTGVRNAWGRAVRKRDVRV